MKVGQEGVEGVLGSIRRYAGERSPFAVTLAVSTILFLAGVPDQGVAPLEVSRGVLSACALLFLLRLSDDVCDVELDRLTHPERLLCADEGALKGLRRLRWVLIALVLLGQAPRWDALAFVAGWIAAFAVFFAVKAKLPALTQVLVLNAALFGFPIYASLLTGGEPSGLSYALGGFFWLGGLAHDTSHCVLDTRNAEPASLPPINRINQRLLAVISLLLFLGAAALGFGLAVAGWVGAPFTAALAVTTAVVLSLEWWLIRDPSAETAKLFYVFGFVFFLLPALAQSVSVLFRS
jgi:4-hydroxybenzoate polyprenyltransferase